MISQLGRPAGPGESPFMEQEALSALLQKLERGVSALQEPDVTALLMLLSVEGIQLREEAREGLGRIRTALQAIVDRLHEMGAERNQFSTAVTALGAIGKFLDSQVALPSAAETLSAAPLASTITPERSNGMLFFLRQHYGKLIAAVLLAGAFTAAYIKRGWILDQLNSPQGVESKSGSDTTETVEEPIKSDKSEKQKPKKSGKKKTRRPRVQE